MNEKIKVLRKTLGLTLEKFGERVGVSKAAISNIEKGNRGVTDQMFKSICREFNVNEEWLRTGTGDMFNLIEDETAAVVSELLEKENPFFNIIVGIMKTYKQLSPESQDVLQNFSEELLENLTKNQE